MSLENGLWRKEGQQLQEPVILATQASWHQTVSLNHLLEFVEFLRAQTKDIQLLRQHKQISNGHYSLFKTNEEVDSLYEFLFDVPRVTPVHPISERNQALPQDFIRPYSLFGEGEND